MIVKEQMHDFSAGEVVPSAFLDRLQLDDVALSTAIVEGLRHYHFPLTVTDEHILSATAAADQFTLESGVTLIVGGVIFNTADFDSLTFGVPDNSTRFLRAEVASDCGTLEAWETTEGVYADPMVRKCTCNLYLTTGSEADAQGAGGGPSGATSMRLLKAVKGVAGTPPVLTYYVNDGLDPATSVETHEAADPAHAASKISYDNSTAGLAGAPTRVQAAIDALATLIAAGLASHAASDPAHAASAIGFDNTAAGLDGDPIRVQTAIEAILGQAATTERGGLIELATDAEAAALTDAERALTPAALGALFGQSISMSGYLRLPGGALLQWGRTPYSSASGFVSTVFPVAFAMVNGVVVTPIRGAYASVSVDIPAVTTGFNYYAWSADGTYLGGIQSIYIAIGR